MRMFKYLMSFVVLFFVWFTQLSAETTDVHFLWRKQFSVSEMQSPAVVGNRIFAAGLSSINCYDRNTGDKIWSFLKEGYIYTSPMVLGDKVFAGIGNLFMALSVVSGKVIWANYTKYPIVDASIASGKIFVKSMKSFIFCYDEKTGKFLWQFHLMDKLFSSIAYNAGKLYFGSSDGKMYCINDTDGQKIWSYSTGGNIYSSPFISRDKVYFGGGDKKLYCLNAKTGLKVWDINLSNNIVSSPCVDNGRLVIRVASDKLYCIDANRGNIIWIKKLLSRITVDPILAGNLIYIACSDKKIYILDMNDGTILSSIGDFDSKVIAFPYFFDGKIYLTTQKGTLLCISNSTVSDSSIVYPASSPFSALRNDHNALSENPETASQDGVVINSTISLEERMTTTPCLVEKHFSDRLLYATGSTVYCMALSDKSVLWKYNWEHKITAAPVSFDGRAFMGDTNGNMFCLDIESGKLLWSKNYDATITVSPCPIIDRVYFGNDSGVFYCIQASNGKVIWKFQTGGKISSSPCISGGRIIFGSGDKSIYCLNAVNGEKLWNFQAGGVIESSPAVEKGMVYFGSDDKNLYCINLVDGTKRWSFQTGGAVTGSPGIRDNYVCFTSDDKQIYCLDSYFGTKIWSYPVEGLVRKGVTIVNGKVYVSSSANKVFCLDLTSGKVLWLKSNIMGIGSTPIVKGDNIILGGNSLYFFQMTNYSETNADPFVQPSDSGMRNVHYSIAADSSKEGKLAWKNSINGVTGSPLALNNRIILCDSSGINQVYEAVTGVMLFQVTYNQKIWSSPIQFGMMTIVCDLNGSLSCYEQDKRWWSVKVGSKILSTPAYANQSFYTTSVDGLISRVSVRGEIMWQYSAGGGIVSSPIIYDGKLIVGCDNGKIYCLNATTGAVVWAYQSEDKIQSSPFVYDDKIYVGNSMAKLICVDVNTGELVWEFQAGGKIFSSPIVVDDEVYFGSYDKKLYCLDSRSGMKYWEFTTSDMIRSSPSYIDGQVLIGNKAGMLYCINAVTGEKIWQYSANGEIIVAPSITSTQVIFGDVAGSLYCVNIGADTKSQNSIAIYPTVSGMSISLMHDRDSTLYSILNAPYRGEYSLPSNAYFDPSILQTAIDIRSLNIPTFTIPSIQIDIPVPDIHITVPHF